jgi:peroxiredoxin
VERWLRDPRRWAALLAAIAALGTAWTLTSAAPATAVTRGRIPGPQEGFLAPDFSVATAAGGTFTLSEQRGHPVVVNLWASWCPPCRAEMPALQQVLNDLAPRGLRMIAVNLTRQDTEPAARAFAEEVGLRLPIGFDFDGQIERLYAVRALPSTFFVDSHGVIQRVVIGGPMRPALIRAEAESLLEASGE